MAKIEINFDVSSIKTAIKQIRDIKKKMKKQIPDLFVTKCLEWIRDRANYYLWNIEMDADVIMDIQSGWSINNVGKNTKQLLNTSTKAVFVEFGVGIVGEREPHPQSGVEGYEYNQDSRFKHSDGRWFFDVHDKQYAIDLKEGFFSVYQRENSGKIVAVTKGSPANLFLYNAGMDLLSTGAYLNIWKQVLKETL